jgi:UDP-3-O-acyl-N-acetylglucosamine deacetylase
MAAKKDASRYTIKFDPAIPSHMEAMQTLNEAGRSKATLIADAIRIRNAIYIRNEDAIAALLPNGGNRWPIPARSQREYPAKALSLPTKTITHDTSDAAQSDDDFWDGMNDVLKLFSV